MKKTIILFTSILLTSTIVNAEEKTLADMLPPKGECVEKHKISPKAFGCGIKNLFKNKDGTPNALGKFYNTKTLQELWKK